MFISDFVHFEMERKASKMSRQHECSTCGVTFSKLSFLQQHRRLLNHHDLFRCDICSKSFNRKDNFIRHQSRHSDNASFECHLCGKLFSRPDNLNRHRQQHDNQYDGAIKRPVENDENEHIPQKRRRLPKDADPHEFYTLRVENQSYIPKFRTTSTNYKITFKDIEVDNLPDILRTLKTLFQSIISNITEFMDPTDLV